MKRILAYLLVCLVLIGGFISGQVFKNKPTARRNIALSASYNSIEELNNHSEIIIRGKVSKEYNDFIVPGEVPIKYRQYEVKINKIFKNSTDKIIEKNNVITLSYQIEVGDFDLVDNKNIESANYILFLNTIEKNDSVYYVPNSPNNIYKQSDLLGSSFINTNRSGLQGVNESSLENFLKKQKGNK